jgi:tellurite resistance protein
VTRMRMNFPPASFFGMALGLLALGILWRVAQPLWNLPSVASEAILAVGAAVWAALIALYLAKWLFARAAARTEFEDPIQCCFIGLAPVTTMLTAAAALPYDHMAATILALVGAAGAVIFAVYRTGRLWMGGREESATTPILYLPTVAAGFVAASTMNALGWGDWGRLAFGAAFFSWLAIESVLIRRLYNAPALPPGLRPTLGIQLAPASVGAVAYLNISGGQADIFAQALLGYALLQALILLRLTPWIFAQPFAPSYWAFSFGLAALPTAVVRIAEQGADRPMLILAPALFLLANVAIGVLAIGTIVLLLRGKLLPAAPSVQAVATPPPTSVSGAGR